MIITITEVSQEFASNGSEYRKVKGTTTDGKETTKSIFNNLEDSWGLLKEGAVLDFAMVKKGQYWNVSEIKPVGQQSTPQSKSSPVKEASGSVPPRSEMSKDDWAEKDRITRRSIERQKSVELAVELAKVSIIKPDQILPSAIKFANWIAEKEVKSAKSLVE